MIKNYLLLAIVSLFLNNLHAQTTAIPDPNFEQALIDLNIDSDKTINGSVLTNDISEVEKLNIDSKNIVNLAGIEGFVKLKELSCITNSLKNLNLNNNVNLVSLACTGNSLKTLEIEKNTALQGLYCEYNQLTSLNLEGLNSLKYLFCSENQISDLDIIDKQELIKLECYSNQITSLNLVNKQELISLVCSSNKINTLDARDCKKLNTLWCQSNKLKLLNVKNGANDILTDFIATDNPELTCISVDDPDGANNANASPYHKWNFDSGIVRFSSDCTGNLTEIPDTDFENLLIEMGIDSDGIVNGQVVTSEIEKITTLYIEYDQSSHGESLDKVSFATIDNPNNIITKHLFHVGEIISLKGLQDFSNLSKFTCSFTNIASLDAIKNLTNLTYLIVDYNDSNLSVDVSKLIHLKSLLLMSHQLNLDLSNNQELTYIYLYDSGGLKNLDLSNNFKLERLALENKLDLNILNLKNDNNSKLTDVFFHNLQELTCIQVDDAIAANAGEGSYKNWRTTDPVTYSEDCSSSLEIEGYSIEDSISFYPNPIKNSLTIKSDKFQIIKVEIYTVLGKKIKEVHSKFEDIKTQNLVKGIYMIKIYSTKGGTMKKIIKI